MDRPVRIGSAVILAVLVVGILVDQRAQVAGYLAQVGAVTALFCAISLVVGYVVPRAAGVREAQAVASSMEIGVHNATLAIFVAVEVLDVVEASVPAAVYSLFMFVLAALWGTWLTRGRGRRHAATTTTTGTPWSRPPPQVTDPEPGPRWPSERGGRHVHEACEHREDVARLATSVRRSRRPPCAAGRRPGPARPARRRVPRPRGPRRRLRRARPAGRAAPGSAPPSRRAARPPPPG